MKGISSLGTIYGHFFEDARGNSAGTLQHICRGSLLLGYILDYFSDHFSGDVRIMFVRGGRLGGEKIKAGLKFCSLARSLAQDLAKSKYLTRS